MSPFYRISYRILAFALVSLFLHGCSLLPSSKSPQPEPFIPPEEETVDAELPPLPFSEDTLLNLLVGELAVHDRDIATAAANYQREARVTRDSAVVERAARLTRFLRDIDAALEMGQLWYELAPDNADAANNLADLYARNQQPQQALDILEAQTRRGQAAQFGLLRNSKLNDEQELQSVIDRLETLAKDNHNNFSLIFTHTLLLQKSGQIEAALKQLHQLDRFESDPVQLALIEAQLLSELERDRDAANVLAKARKKHPDEDRLALAHARKLIKVDLAEAKQAFEQLLQDQPENSQLLMSHALLAIELENYEQAEASLQRLLALRKEVSFANYNLGLVAEKRGQLEQALEFNAKVKRGEHLLPAIHNSLTLLRESDQIDRARHHLNELRLRHPIIAPTLWGYEAAMLSKIQQYEEAHRVLSSAILQFPEQHSLRMQRSFASEELDQLDLVETDLRYILQRQPNHAEALNALGYILADRTTRYVEARELIEKAFKLLPDSAAVMDSMGWVMYKQGETEAALVHLEKAFDMVADDEIASHLIEIYWLRGEHGKARKIYKRLRKHSEEHPIVDETARRLDIRF